MSQKSISPPSIQPKSAHAWADSISKMNGHNNRFAAQQVATIDATDAEEQYRVQLERTNKELEAFSYSVSHDLRAPLRAIDGFSRILIEEYSEKLDADATKLLAVVRQNAVTMGRLIDDLLAYSRLVRQPLELAEIDMAELADHVFTHLDLNGDRNRIRFALGSIPQARADLTLMRQVFINLISNAIKYSKNNDEPAIEVQGYTRECDAVYYVKDNGVGFDMKYAGKLFGVFQRLHSPEQFEGTGMGLAIVQHIIHRHGGTVWAEAKVNEGATFHFSLPV